MTDTLMIIKQDAVKNNKIGSILYEIEELGYKIEDMAFFIMSDYDAKCLYNMHEARPTFEGLIEFMIDGPSLCLILSGFGENTARNLAELKSSIRERVATNETIYHNAIHVSDSTEDAKREINIIFGFGYY